MTQDGTLLEERGPLDPSDGHVDGNAVAGALAAVFVTEITTALVRCRACGDAGPFAALMVWAHGPGVVGRCPSCEAVLLRYVATPGRVRVDLSGIAELELAPVAAAGR
ncbi:hypothetical protein GCM10025864_16890 [Luteimicrobium album]|uniref:Uncharacterized protein n=1 Tax=Luteimicrobium album TaxID=1054550 RepID=A0ABQ6HZS5_9MICO|nr:DUF6510 family protein [Luteimicrobium album]GMA23930.1 hypothetical protein GCM10025864_16890 [Luteimicrobium album]